MAPKPVTVPVVPLPVKEPEGEPVTVHVPEAGKPLKATLPVARAQVGWVITPTVGAEGVEGWALITALPDDDEVHPDELVTVKV